MRFWKLLHAPCLGSTEGGVRGRRATWLELFFDLIFVAAVAQVGRPLHSDYSFAALSRYGFLFFLIWWAWLGHTVYSTRFDTDDLTQRVLTLLQMFAVAVMAANAGEALDSRSAAGFGAAYAGMRVILVLQYLRARSIEKSKRLTNHHALGFGLAAGFWIIAAFLGAPLRFWIWGVAVVLDIGTTVLSSRHEEALPPHPEHLPERFGLFTIILMGESLVAIMRGIESQEYWSGPAASAAFSGMALVFVYWWWYFDGARAAKERHLRTAKEFRRFRVWSYAHFPLYLGIATLGIGVEHIVGLGQGAYLHRGEAWLVAASAVIVMASLATIAATSEEARSSRGLRDFLAPHGLLAAAALLLGGLNHWLPPYAYVIVLAIVGAVQVGISLTERRTHEPVLES
jgi:low temperature requirement protein LtrA